MKYYQAMNRNQSYRQQAPCDIRQNVLMRDRLLSGIG